MPAASEAQRRAMEAAAHGHSTLGIPKSVGEEFTRADDAKLSAAGIAFVTPNGHALFVRRGAGGDHSGEWCFPGGGIEDGGTPVTAAKREALEEIGAMPPGGLGLLDRNTSKDGVDYNLAAFKSGRALQLVFADSTNGDSTYSVGRFLFVAPNPDGTVTLDFNLAVLPPCAFSYNFNCPLPPAQNRFAVPIEAGEKNVLNKQGELLH